MLQNVDEQIDEGAHGTEEGEAVPISVMDGGEGQDSRGGSARVNVDILGGQNGVTAHGDHNLFRLLDLSRHGRRQARAENALRPGTGQGGVDVENGVVVGELDIHDLREADAGGQIGRERAIQRHDGLHRPLQCGHLLVEFGDDAGQLFRPMAEGLHTGELLGRQGREPGQADDDVAKRDIDGAARRSRGGDLAIDVVVVNDLTARQQKSRQVKRGEPKAVPIER